MQFPFSQFPRQIATYVFSILLGAILTAGVYRVLPSQAGVAPKKFSSYQEAPALLAQSTISRIPETAAGSFVTAAVNRVGKAVVRIDTERTVNRNPDPLFDDPFFRRFFGEELPRGPMQERLRGQGSGFIIDKSGIILTNSHVVNRADKVTVRLKDGRTLEGKVQGADPVTDLAVIKINDSSDLPVAPLGDSNEVQVGDWAIAVGNPLGLDNTVTLGIISTLKRSSAQVGIPDKRIDFIQTDAAINPGNSGGPLLNQQGEVIGINTAIRADAMGIGFAIPINKAKVISSALARGEKVAHPYLGIQMATLTPEVAAENNSDPNAPFEVPEINGILVVRVLPNTPAAASGMRRGDVIVQIDGQAVETAAELQRIVDSSRIGQMLEMKVQRGRETTSIGIRTGELQEQS
ncbi:trypsin-like peptidase domain-containing protein [Funiculus sociatus GB2-A5]|uniref:Trypsin-like peptidase domain-containing protein n=1 Tax=Funiculus sociatus GB2-A5 TaxID=2933946 RepID=A0ABV0JJH2_9CYAN|nr:MULTISPECIES: HhoA/HhoB/HtrA family serine endopeptidase [unclassified Trichocoleus]MBD1908438.1 trypsin-like peptidase domain-containing protein [Trichocoleus sp. FACHB-832]MBD2061658.1 trypsin-like peptidase domain-containing protein [Trichocoleus sp. FACHB-6]